MRGRMNAGLLVGGVLVGIVVLAALVSFLWTPHDPTLVDAAQKTRAPGGGYLLGADKFGRDTLSQLMVGARTTLYVGIVAVGIAAVLGTPLGVIAGMTPRGWLSELIMRVNDLVFAFPALLLAVMLGAVYGAGTLTAMIAIGVATVPAP
jgi:peptide/nickel transport system permease protein